MFLTHLTELETIQAARDLAPSLTRNDLRDVTKAFRVDFPELAAKIDASKSDLLAGYCRYLDHIHSAFYIGAYCTLDPAYFSPYIEAVAMDDLTPEELAQEGNVEIQEEVLDVHATTASALFDKPIEELTEDERRLGKQVNSANLYSIPDPWENSCSEIVISGYGECVLPLPEDDYSDVACTYLDPEQAALVAPLFARLREPSPDFQIIHYLKVTLLSFFGLVLSSLSAVEHYIPTRVLPLLIIALSNITGTFNQMCWKMSGAYYATFHALLCAVKYICIAVIFFTIGFVEGARIKSKPRKVIAQ